MLANFKTVTFGAMAIFMIVGNSALAGGAGNTGGGCYNLEIIGSPAKKVDMTGSSGHSLFVPISGSAKINLYEGPFNVLDRNGTDGTASFQLPNPDPTNSGTTVYSVFMRMVGKPGTGLNMNTCAYDTTGELFCSNSTVSMKRIAGTSKFVNVSSALLYIYADIDGDGTIDRVPLFSDSLEDYYWQVDTQGRAHAQLRFCPVSTVVP